MGDTSLGVCGLGLIGSSIARAWLERGPVVAWDPDPGAVRLADSLGVRTTTSLAELAEADIVVLAAPTAENSRLLGELIGSDRQPVTMDVGSAKSGIVQVWRDRNPDYPFVATHPMAGSELAGFQSGHSGLFVDAAWPVVVDEATDGQALVTALQVVLALGAWPVPVSAQEHDSAVAEISHLPHLLAGALGQTTAVSPTRALALRLAAGSYRDVSRVSASPPKRTAEFIMANRNEAAARARSAAASLLEAADMLADGEQGRLVEWLEKGRDLREDFEACGNQETWQVLGGSARDVRRELLRQRDTGDRVLAIGPAQAQAAAQAEERWDMTLAGALLPTDDPGDSQDRGVEDVG